MGKDLLFSWRRGVGIPDLGQILIDLRESLEDHHLVVRQVGDVARDRLQLLHGLGVHAARRTSFDLLLTVRGRRLHLGRCVLGWSLLGSGSLLRRRLLLHGRGLLLLRLRTSRLVVGRGRYGHSAVLVENLTEAA